MFTLLDKLGITVEKVTCHHFSGDRRFLGTDPEPNAKLAKSIQHCSRVEHGTLTLHLNLFGFGQIERSWDGFKFKSSFPTSFCWHLASTSSPFLGVFESQQIARSLPGTGAPWLRSSPCAPYDAGWRGWCCWRRFRRRPRWWRRWRRWNWGRSWPQRRGSCLELVTGISKSVWIFHGESNWIWDTAETVPPNFRERPNGCAQNIVAGGITCMGKNSWSRNG